MKNDTTSLPRAAAIIAQNKTVYTTAASARACMMWLRMARREEAKPTGLGYVPFESASTLNYRTEVAYRVPVAVT